MQQASATDRLPEPAAVVRPELPPLPVRRARSLRVDVFAPGGARVWLERLGLDAEAWTARPLEWAEFLAARPGSLAQILVLPCSWEREMLARIGELDGRPFLTPTVLVTERPGVSPGIKRFTCVHDVHWMDEGGARLAGMLKTLARGSLLSVLPSLVRATIDGGAEVEPGLEYLDRMCGPLPLPEGVEEAALELDVSYATLLRSWNRAFPPPRLRPEELTEVTRLARALVLRQGLPSWKAVSGELDLHVRTLERTCIRWSRRTPGELRDLPPFLLTRWVVDALVGPLARGSDGP